jgi:hypothetical protein
MHNKQIRILLIEREYNSVILKELFGVGIAQRGKSGGALHGEVSTLLVGLFSLTIQRLFSEAPSIEVFNRTGYE